MKAKSVAHDFPVVCVVGIWGSRSRSSSITLKNGKSPEGGQLRYDLSDRPAKGVAMYRGKAVQEGVRIRLSKGMTWEKLAAMSPEEIREKDLFPAGFFPLPLGERGRGEGVVLG